MAEIFDETENGAVTAKFVVVSTNRHGYATELHDTRAAAEDVAANWMEDDDELLVLVAKVVTRYTAEPAKRNVKRQEVR